MVLVQQTFATITVNTVEDSLGGIPISKINTTNQIASFDLDSYEFDVSIPSTMLGAVESTLVVVKMSLQQKICTTMYCIL